jgi:hypothetical protein
MQYLTDNSDRGMQRGDENSDWAPYLCRLWRKWDRARPTLARTRSESERCAPKPSRRGKA